jgi:WD40 repeat protein
MTTKSAAITFLCILTALATSAQQVQTMVQTGHYSAVTAICYSYDGKLIATGSSDKTVKLWRRSDGLEIRSFQGIGSGIKQVSINNQLNSLMTVGENGVVTVFNLFTGSTIRQFKLENDKFSCAAFNPDGSRIITGSYKSYISVWDAATGNKVMDIRAVPATHEYAEGYDYPEAGSVAWSRDGKYIIAGVADYTAILWDSSTGNEIRKYKKIRSTCTSCISEAVITPDNKYIINTSDDTIKVFDRESGNLVKKLFGQSGSPEGLNISPDGRYAGAIEYGVAQLWDLSTGILLTKSGNYSERKVLCMAISPDGKEFAAGNEKRTADLVSVTTGKPIMVLRGYLNQVDERILNDPYMYWAGMVNETKLSPEGKYIAVGRTGNNAKLIDFKTGKVFRTLKGHNAMVISLCFSSNGKYLATGGLDGKAIVWDVESGNAVNTFTFPDEKEAIYSLDFSADNRMLAAAVWGGYVIIWDLESGNRIKAISPHDRLGCYQVRFTPNGVYFISAGLDKKLKLIEIDTGEEVRSFVGHTNETLINSINFNSAGDKFVTAAWDGTVRVWDFMSGLQILKIKAHDGGVYSAKFDPSGKYIISGGDDFKIKLWDANTGVLISEYQGHTGGVGDVNITSDLKYIISGSKDGSVRIWDRENKKEIVSLVFINDDDWFIRNPEGYFDASQGAFSSISFVNGIEIYSISQFFNEFFRPGLYNEMMGSESSVFREKLNQTIDKFPPPSVEFVLPENGLVSDKPIISFMVNVTNKGGGVKELRVLQNGKSQDVDYSDLKRMNKAGQSAMKTFELNLIPGQNEILVTAFSNGEIESAPARLNVKYTGLQRIADCYILSIGINKYENESMNLTYARGDAEAFAESVTAGSKNIFKNVFKYTLFDKEASKNAILSALDEISKKIKKEDVFIFFYAGHGSVVDNGFYFITPEVTGMYQKEKLQNALYVVELQEKFKHLSALKQVVFVDACHSGSSVEALAMRGGAEEKALAQLSRSSGIHVMASSESQQQSAEIQSLNHGVFTYVLLEALSGKADGAPADSKITVYEIKSYIDDQVPEISYRLIRHRQFPSTFSIGHDFPLVM